MHNQIVDLEDPRSPEILRKALALVAFFQEPGSPKVDLRVELQHENNRVSTELSSVHSSLLTPEERKANPELVAREVKLDQKQKMIVELINVLHEKPSETAGFYVLLDLLAQTKPTSER